MTLLYCYMIGLGVVLILLALDESIDTDDAPWVILCVVIWPLFMICLAYVWIRRLKERFTKKDLPLGGSGK